MGILTWTVALAFLNDSLLFDRVIVFIRRRMTSYKTTNGERAAGVDQLGFENQHDEVHHG